MTRLTLAAFSLATPRARRLLPRAIRCKTGSGCGPDHQHHHQHHQRLPLQLPAKLVGLVRDGAPPQIAGLGGALELCAASRQSQDLGSVQREQSKYPRPFLGWTRSVVARRRFHAERQPPVPVWRHLSAQLGLHQRNDSGGTINAFPVYSLGNGTNGSGLRAI